jgi:ligand-binding SRPBCC domain-containing protein
MFTLTYPMTIHCPVERVFAYLTNRANLTHWFASVQKVVQEEPNGVGAKATITAQIVGVTFSLTSEMIAYESNPTFAVKIDKPFPLMERYTFTSQGSSTELDYAGTVHVQGFFNMMTPVLRRLFTRQFTTSFPKLKEVLESDEEPGMQAL